MELAEPRVRTGVWEHTNFRVDPIRRLRRTGFAAMVTIYGARSMAEAMIARIRRMHDMVAGTTPSGEAYCANDPELLTWVQGTAAYGFLQAYHAYVQPLSLSERDCYYAEGISAAALYGATSAPRSEADLEMLFQATAGRLERSDIVFEFLTIMRSTPFLPLPLRPVQHLLVRAAIDLTPRWLRMILGLNAHGLHRLGGRGGPAGRRICGPPCSGIQPSRTGLSAHAASSRLFVVLGIGDPSTRAVEHRRTSPIWRGSLGSECAPPMKVEAVGTSLCDRRLASHRLSYFEALELGMLQIEWPGRIIAGARVCSAELLRFGPRLEGGFALPHRVGGIERMVFGVRPFEQMELDEPRYAIEI